MLLRMLPNVTFIPQIKVDRFINRRGITGLPVVGFAEQDLPIRAPLDRFRVDLMT